MPVAELSRYFDIQDSPDLVTKAQVLAGLRERGQSISGRNLTYYASVGLIPPAIRIGSRVGAYPEVVIDQLSWVITCRERGLSLEAIKELLPLWQWLVLRSRDCVDLAEFELIARRGDLSEEANLAVPLVVDAVVHSLCAECLQKITWILKDGTSRQHTEATPVTLSFILGRQDEDGVARLVSWTQLTLPGIEEVDPASPVSITLGLPVGVELTITSPRQRQAASGRACRRRKRQQLEELPLA